MNLILSFNEPYTLMNLNEIKYEEDFYCINLVHIKQTKLKTSALMLLGNKFSKLIFTA